MRTHQMDKLYYCTVCHSMGRGNRFVEHHITDGCKGISRRTKKNNELGVYKGREDEGKLNTAIHNATQMIEDERRMFLEMKARIEADIERMKQMGQVSGASIY